MSQTLETGYVAVDGGELYYEAVGSGLPLVFVHAGVADSRMWDAQVAHFSPKYRVIRYDTRGFGRSKTEAVSFSNRQDLLAVLDHCKVDQAILIGNSRGGSIAIDSTLSFPDRVKGLVVLGSGLGGFGSEEIPPDLVEPIGKMQAAQEAKDWALLAELEARFWADGPNQPAGRADNAVYEAVRSMTYENFINQPVEADAQPLDPPAVGRLAEIQVPLLIFIGLLDEADCVEAAKYLAEHVTNAQYVAFPDVAHMVSLEKPQEFNRIIDEFIDRNHL
ncbi:alpha/beta fold hydrolase [Herpetosiphon llansteffanensis]|uniref:alpha/beta fold hydrolase n=1 Tax=Herpetosiphon llansteffanensis TaxID=2094568 RepID=UPI000D7D05FD|nr:alpha/beta hydrolase [Herpetosiphon llansteffanensis]